MDELFGYFFFIYVSQTISLTEDKPPLPDPSQVLFRQIVSADFVSGLRTLTRWTQHCHFVRGYCPVFRVQIEAGLFESI